MADSNRYQKAFLKAHNNIQRALAKAAPAKITPGPNQQHAMRLLEDPAALQNLLVARRAHWTSQGIHPDHADLMAKQEINAFMRTYHPAPPPPEGD
jgi:hypothetical protein